MAGQRLPILAHGRGAGIPIRRRGYDVVSSNHTSTFQKSLPDVSVRGEVLADPLSSFSQKIVFTGCRRKEIKGTILYTLHQNCVSKRSTLFQILILQIMNSFSNTVPG